MPQPLVTIGIPCYNCAPYLPMLIRSIQAQTYPHWRVIAIDDGSQDGTADFLRSIADSRFQVLIDNENLGLARRLNQIADLAQGDLLARTDADDILLPHRIERQVQAFVEDQRLDVCSSGLYVVDNHNRVRGLRRVPELAQSARDVMLRNGPSHPTVMSTRSWALQNRYRCEYRRGEDLDLWIRTIEVSRIRILPEALHIIREDTQFDGVKYQNTIRDHRQVVRHYLSKNGDVMDMVAVQGLMLVRSWVYQSAVSLGCSNWLAGRRNLPLSAADRAAIVSFLDGISAPSAEGEQTFSPVSV